MEPLALFATLEGKPYSEFTCFDVAAALYRSIYGVSLEESLPLSNGSHPAIAEVWYAGDPVSPYTLIEPFDLCWFAIDTPVCTHVGVALGKDTSYREFIGTSTQELGVHRVLLSRWAPYLMQIVRVQKGG